MAILTRLPGGKYGTGVKESQRQIRIQKHKITEKRTPISLKFVQIGYKTHTSIEICQQLAFLS
jgi:hypothetical protein